MAFNQMNVVNYPATTSFTGGAGALVALSGRPDGSVTSAASLVIAVGSPAFNIEWGSLCAIVSAGVTTSSLLVETVWQGSNDGTNWFTIYAMDCEPPSAVAATGTGSLVTTAYMQTFNGFNPSCKYLRLAVISSGAAGGAGDNVKIGYCWRKRFGTV